MSEEYDNELLTDLTVVFFGLGIFLANAPRNKLARKLAMAERALQDLAGWMDARADVRGRASTLEAEVFARRQP